MASTRRPSHSGGLAPSSRLGLHPHGVRFFCITRTNIIWPAQNGGRRNAASLQGSTVRSSAGTATWTRRISKSRHAKTSIPRGGLEISRAHASRPIPGLHRAATNRRTAIGHGHGPPTSSASGRGSRRSRCARSPLRTILALTTRRTAILALTINLAASLFFTIAISRRRRRRASDSRYTRLPYRRRRWRDCTASIPRPCGCAQAGRVGDEKRGRRR